MKIKRIILFIVFLFVVVLSNFLTGHGLGTEKTVIKFSDFVYRITLDFGLRPNIGVSAGPDGIMLVDTGHQDVAGELLTAVNQLKEGDIKYIINTHPHGDHAGGNKTCGENAVVIGYDDLGQMVSEGVLTPGDESNNFYSLDFNGEEIRIIPSPGAHSDKDLIIYFTESGVVHMGDLLLTQSFPAVGPRVKKYLEILDWVFDEFPPSTKFIGGHGRDYTMVEVKEYHKMLQDTINIVHKKMKAGKAVEDMKQEGVLKDYKSWGVFLEFLDTDYWITSIHESYKNE
ncbi:MAG: MBL fold metallo-hydrolase [Candidatus Aminicenantes bacterium]|nr:MAG: MBL fold metallo-hydrolase [Candidatus Aminicenantes bacterium]